MKKLILILLLFFVGAASVFATELPSNVVPKLKKDIPGVTIRFDGLVEYPDNTQYLPIFPMDLKKSTQEAKIVLTHPANLSLQDKPDMVLFDNNFAMLKIIKNPSRNPTVIFYNEMPLCVKRGLLPQDLLVPENLVMPEELAVLLGNLYIPVDKLSDNFDYFKDFDRFFDPAKAQEVKKTNPLPSANAFDKNLPSLARKVMYAINYQANGVYLINPENGKVVKVIPLRSTPSNFIMTRNQRYLLVTMLGTSKLAVVDLDVNAVIKEIESGVMPNSIVVDYSKNVAYVSNQNSSTISVIDLVNMAVKEKIEVKGNPSKIAIAPDGKSLIYLDVLTDGVYKLTLNEDFKENTLLFKTRNLSKLILTDEKVYVACRDQNFVTVVNLETNKPIVKIPVGEKPLDMSLVNSKLYVVNAVSDSLSVIDANLDQKIKDISLVTGGFPSKINLLDKPNQAIVTTSANHEYVLVNLEKNSIIKKFPIDAMVSSIIVSKGH